MPEMYTDTTFPGEPRGSTFPGEPRGLWSDSWEEDESKMNDLRELEDGHTFRVLSCDGTKTVDFPEDSMDVLILAPFNYEGGIRGREACNFNIKAKKGAETTFECLESSHEFLQGADWMKINRKKFTKKNRLRSETLKLPKMKFTISYVTKPKRGPTFFCSVSSRGGSNPTTSTAPSTASTAPPTTSTQKPGG